MAQPMRKAVKFLHTLASCVLIGALLAHGLLLLAPPPQLGFADQRAIIGLIGTWLLLPSMAVVLTSGLLSMVVHQPFMEQRWVWTKAALSFLVFLATLHLQGLAVNSAAFAASIPPGEPVPPALAADLAHEDLMIGIVLAVSVANIVFGVWRPRMKPRPARAPG
jgi:hypothetical protein